ncbi:MAG: hypothetical protein NZ761_03385, partial [Dehalococcoidia bacterium]|nr:hypothetical protein [Dehalococcoidia bacterium]
RLVDLVVVLESLRQPLVRVAVGVTVGLGKGVGLGVAVGVGVAMGVGVGADSTASEAASRNAEYGAGQATLRSTTCTVTQARAGGLPEETERRVKLVESRTQDEEVDPADENPASRK